MLTNFKSICLASCVALALSGCTASKNFIAEKTTPQAERDEKNDLKFEVARVSEKQGKLLPAKEVYLELLEQNPRDTRVLHRLGVVCAKLDDHEQASHFFVKALRAEPHNSEVLTDFGYSLYLKGDYSAAEYSLKQAIEENGKNERAINNLAMVVGHQGRMEESYALFRRVVGEAEATANLAYVYSQRGDIENATNGYSRALTIDAGLEKASMALVQIAQNDSAMEQLAATKQTPRAGEQQFAQPVRVAEVPTTQTQQVVRRVSAPAQAPAAAPMPLPQAPLRQWAPQAQSQSQPQPEFSQPQYSQPQSSGPLPVIRSQMKTTRKVISGSSPVEFLDTIEEAELSSTTIVEELPTDVANEKWYEKWERQAAQKPGVRPISADASVDESTDVSVNSADAAEAEWDKEWDDKFVLPVIRTESKQQ